MTVPTLSHVSSGVSLLSIVQDGANMVDVPLTLLAPAAGVASA
jgi:hypothetical protein